MLTYCQLNTLRPRRNGRFTDDILKLIFFNENVSISIKNSLKFVPTCPVNNITTLVQIMAWRHPGNKPLSEPVVVCLPMPICVTRPQPLGTNNEILAKIQAFSFKKKYLKMFSFCKMLAICKKINLLCYLCLIYLIYSDLNSYWLLSYTSLLGNSICHSN